MPVFDIEMLWDCPACKAKRNLGLTKHCRKCGFPKDDTCTDYMPDNVTVAEGLLLDKAELAAAGPDWKCLYCGSLQSALNKCCTECGAPQGSSKPWASKAEPATFNPFSGVRFPEPDPLPADLPPLPESGKTPSVPPRASTSPRRSSAPPAPPLFIRWAPIAIGVPCVAALGLVLFLLFRTHTEDVKVASIAWEHKILIDRYQVMHREGWMQDLDGFNSHYLGSHIHHYDHVRVGSHTEHYTAHESCGLDCRTVKGSCTTSPVHCTPSKNGAARCTGGDRTCSPDTQSCTTKYCDVDRTRSVDDYEEHPAYWPWFSWDIWDWGYNRTVTHAGVTTEESWPVGDELATHLSEGEKEREQTRQMTHKVTFVNAKGETWSYEPQTCQDFERFPVGGAWRIKVGVARAVEVLPSRRWSSW